VEAGNNSEYCKPKSYGLDRFGLPRRTLGLVTSGHDEVSP
jgi:hypothetical protein